MTMPTSLPRNFPEVRFPYEFTQQYYAPLQYFGESGGARGGAVKMAVGALGGWPPKDGFASEADIVHKNRRSEALQQVHAGLESRWNSRLRQMTGGAYQAQHMRMEGGSMMTGVGTIEGAPVLAGRGLHGGVMRTLAGRQHIVKRLSSRIGELNAVDSQTWDSEQQPEAEAPGPALDEDASTVELIGENLASISDAMTAGVWDKDTAMQSRMLLVNLLKVGGLIPQNALTGILRQLIGALSELQAVAGSAGNMLGSKERGIVRLVFTHMERARAIIEMLSSPRVVSMSAAERQMALRAFASQLSKLTEAQRLRGAPGTPVRPRGQRAAPIPRGAHQRVFPGVNAGFRPAQGVPGMIAVPPGTDVGNLFE